MGVGMIMVTSSKSLSGLTNYFRIGPLASSIANGGACSHPYKRFVTEVGIK